MMPEIVHAEALVSRALHQLTEDGIDAIPPARKRTTQVRLRILFPATDGSEQHDAPLGE